ncbi:MAG: tetratricopeptide repeat protein [Niabella sp.]
MKKPQYLTIIISVLVLCVLWAFAKTVPSGKPSSGDEGHQKPIVLADESVLTSSFSIDSALASIKKSLPAQNNGYVNNIEHLIATATDKEEKLHKYHQLSKFFKDSARAFIPYVWYTAEGARLENSEKNLNFAGHLFVNNLQNVEDGELRKWMALQAKDLLERSLKINPDNDSAKVALGATYMFGGISNAPMQGIAKIREVVAKDSTNIYAQMTLAMGSLMSGQTEKAQERLETVTRLDPKNIQAILLLADLFEKNGSSEEAIRLYQKAVPLITDHSEMKEELEKRIVALKKQN